MDGEKYKSTMREGVGVGRTGFGGDRVVGYVVYWRCLKDALVRLTLYCADRPKPPNPSYAQTVQNRPVHALSAWRSFLDDFELDNDVCNVNNVDSDHGDPVIVHLCCLCDFSLLRFEKDDPSAACLFRRYAAILLIGSSSVLCLVYLF